MKTVEEIRNKKLELMKQHQYLYNFLYDLYKGSDAKPKVERELSSINREIKILDWILNEELPF